MNNYRFLVSIIIAIFLFSILIFIGKNIHFSNFKGFSKVAKNIKQNRYANPFDEDIPLQKNMMKIGAIKFSINTGKLTKNVYMYFIAEFKNKKYVNGKDIPEIKTIILQLLNEQGINDVKNIRKIKKKLIERLNRKKYKGALKNIYITKVITSTE